MPRARFFCDPNSPYHVTTRCINKEWFECELGKVWQIFTTHLLYVHRVYDLRIHAFVLMSNHFHLLATSPRGNLSEALCFLLRESSRDIRETSSRINQTFAERFKRTKVHEPNYYLNTYKYIYQNPIRAGLAEKVEDYRYSTLRWVLGLDAMLFPVEDKTLIRDTDNTLNWLNQPIAENDVADIRLALLRPEFKLPKSPSRYANHLENELV